MQHTVLSVLCLNNQGWTQNMDGEGNPPVLSLSTTVLSGRAVMNIDGHNIDLSTLGGKNSWTNYGGINDRGENVRRDERHASRGFKTLTAYAGLSGPGEVGSCRTAFTRE
jgi:hypothetical protein